MPRILLAETHAPTREYVTTSLSQAGFEVVSAGDAARAYEVFAAERPDAVVLGADVDDAAVLARRLREASPRVLLIVTDREHLGRARGLQALLPMKANAYVADPTRRDLVEKVQQLVAQRAPERVQGTAQVLAREPTSRGEVRPAVVAKLLHQIWRSRAEGILVVEGGGPTRRLGFSRGAPVMVQSDEPSESLLRWLRQAGRLGAAAHDAALQSMASGLSPGAALIAAGVVQPGPPLQELLSGHLRSVVVRTVGVREGRWRFHPGGEFAEEGAGLEVLPLQVIVEGARLGIPAKHFADALKAVTDAYPVRTAEFQQIVPAAGLASSDLRLALSLDGRLTTRAWLEARSAEMKDALSLLWFLSLVRGVAFPATPAADGAYGKALVRRKRPLPPERGEALRQEALRILPGTYLHALGVEVDADAGAVEQAYRRVAARFHPDAFAAYDVGELADLLSAVQDKLAAAYRTLADEGRRRAYLEYLLQRLEQTGSRRPGVDLPSELALKRGERALRARQHAEAVAALREAVQRGPREPEYQAMLAFALLFDPAQAPADRAQEARKAARRALALAPEHPRATAALALAEEALGDLAEARKVTLAALKVHAGSELLKKVLFRVNRVRT